MTSAQQGSAGPHSIVVRLPTGHVIFVTSATKLLPLYLASFVELVPGASAGIRMEAVVWTVSGRRDGC